MSFYTDNRSPSKQGPYRHSMAMCAGQWLPCWTHSLSHSFSSFLLPSTPKLFLYHGCLSCITYKHLSMVFKTSTKALFSLPASETQSCSLPITILHIHKCRHHKSLWSRQSWLGLFASVLVYLNCLNKIL